MQTVENPFSQESQKPIGALLQARGLITSQDLDKALAFQRQFKGRLGSVLVRMGALSEDALLPVLSEQLGLSLLAVDQLPSLPGEILGAIQLSGLSPEWFADQQLVIWEGADGVIHCASRNPIDSNLQETLAIAMGEYSQSWHFVRTQDLERLLKLIQLSPEAEYEDEVAHLRELAEEAPVIELVGNVLAQAIDEGASDIHIEPEENTFEVRYRIDGVMQARLNQPRERFDAVASRIKLISGMDIAERRLPQDGRITMRASGADMDIRVSALPGVHGESIVMRLLPKERSNLNLEWLGMEADHLAQFSRWVQEPHGIILVTGPTGSGKSTTLYAALDAANDRSKKIITVEDPVEYKLAGVTQIQTHSEIGYDFARALRAILRQDPDVIMIGEIRDLETAEIAVQSALTGHLVLSTLHTNDALSAFTRLLDMGVEPFLVASSVRAVQAQRLVRKLCDQCARPAEPPPAIVEISLQLRELYPTLLSQAPAWRVPAGCPHCRGSGYRGRIGIYELVEVSPAIKNAVMQRTTAGEMVGLARQEGYRSLREDGLIKAWRGLTSIDEVLRVTGIGESEE
ncbi:MAG: GspE/PulE family protein [Sulfurimicrobium sp.]|nr:GspE/PulE family protein [Sulfurimicrobium sp.]MDP1705576.1 GspE/PulE family protein [Sulfurimicrobium sp.]MDP2199686.1 GspE/PulE family protein [Sulfurimicrobium sp.]MDP3685993.1 GspE/PulE family protein [Sulfurimicrobium sp.]